MNPFKISTTNSSPLQMQHLNVSFRQFRCSVDSCELGNRVRLPLNAVSTALTVPFSDSILVLAADAVATLSLTAPAASSVSAARLTVDPDELLWLEVSVRLHIP